MVRVYTPHGQPVRAVELSENRKLGPCSATYASFHSCPENCAFKDNGCYAERGPVGIISARLTDNAFRSPESIARLEAAAILQLTGRFDLRLHVVGDCKTDRAAKIVSFACDEFTERSKRFRKDDQTASVWTYTHAWQTVKRESWGEVSVLASCETEAQVTEAATRGYAPCVVVDHFESTKAYVTDGGTTLLPCPYQTTGRQCVDCRLCMKDGKLLQMGVAIAFQAHGPGKSKVRKTLQSLGVVA